MKIEEAEIIKTIVDNKLLLMNKLSEINKHQNDLMKKMSKEKCDDIFSVLRSKDYANSIIELEVKKELLIDLLSKTK